MEENRRLELIRDKFPEIVARLNVEKNSNYENMSSQEKIFFKDIFETLQKADSKLFMELFQTITTCSEKSIQENKMMEQNFDLKDHLQLLHNDLVGKNTLFDKKLADDVIKYQPAVDNLYLNYSYLDAKDADGYVKQAENVLEKLKNNQAKPNQKLAQCLDNEKIVFRVFKGDRMDGKCQYRKLNKEDKRRTLVINLSEGCFNKHKEALGMVMAHELSHFIDGKGRPEGYQGKLPVAQEYFADALGYKMAANCGFDIEHYKAENRNLGQSFFSERMDYIEQLQQNDKVLSAYMMRHKFEENNEM